MSGSPAKPELVTRVPYCMMHFSLGMNLLYSSFPAARAARAITEAMSSAAAPRARASMLNSMRKELKTMHGRVISTTKSVSLPRTSSEKIFFLRQ